MKVEYINPFIEAGQNIITETTGFLPKMGKIYIKNTPFKGDNVVILIGITGSVQGSVTISLRKTLACKIASAMMGGMPVAELDEIAKSAVSELSNMILGNAANIFYKNNISIDITPPTVLTGENMQISASKSAILCIPFEFDCGETMEIDLAYKEI